MVKWTDETSWIAADINACQYLYLREIPEPRDNCLSAADRGSGDKWAGEPYCSRLGNFGGDRSNRATATIATEGYPGPFQHIGVICLNHIIDVVSTTITRLRRDFGTANLD